MTSRLGDSALLGFLGLGSSMGDRREHLVLAVGRIQRIPQVELVRVSRLYRTPPMKGGSARGWFLNAVLRVRTTLEPDPLLAKLVEVERRAGHRPSRHWGDRLLDIDVLHMEGVTLSSPTLTLPHPGIGQRSFVLTPLNEVWPEGPWRGSAPPPGPRAVPVGVLAPSPRPS